MKKYNNYIIGEKPPFLNCSKAAYGRLGEALTITGSKLTGSSGIAHDFIACVSIPEGQEEIFVKICKCTLSLHPIIQVGHEFIHPTHSYEE